MDNMGICNWLSCLSRYRYNCLSYSCQYHGLWKCKTCPRISAISFLADWAPVLYMLLLCCSEWTRIWKIRISLNFFIVTFKIFSFTFMSLAVFIILKMVWKETDERWGTTGMPTCLSGLKGQVTQEAQCHHEMAVPNRNCPWPRPWPPCHLGTHPWPFLSRLALASLPSPPPPLSLPSLQIAVEAPDYFPSDCAVFPSSEVFTSSDTKRFPTKYLILLIHSMKKKESNILLVTACSHEIYWYV